MTKAKLRFGRLDMDARISRADYEERLATLQHTLSRIQQAYLLQGHSAVIVFEGWDAAGKGGTIRRLSVALDPRGFKVWPIGAPAPSDLARHYLARFWERLPPHGAVACFDRSWYGRVLVERVEALTPPERLRDAYSEIVTFENLLIADGVRVVKIFLHISRDEQLRRFRDRLHDPLKRWKLSFEDFRNRDRWDAYIAAAEEMFDRTSTAAAPWTLISAEQKKHARIAALERIVSALSEGVDLSPPAVDETVLEAAMRHLDLPPRTLSTLRGRTD